MSPKVSMLRGELVTLRPLRESDLGAFIDAHIDIRNRGRFFPLDVTSEAALRTAYAENGYWGREDGTLVIWGPDDEMAGHIGFFKPVSYWDAFELYYLLWDDRFAGKGFVTEAVQLLTDYLFATKKVHRIHLVIVPENAASRRIAQKCGFTLEGTVRGAFFNDGRNQDVLLFSLLRDDPRPWRAADRAR